MKKTILTTAIVLTQLFSFANTTYKETVYENADVKITISSALSTSAYFKMKFDISNKTKNILFFKTSDMKLKINDKEFDFVPREGMMTGKVDEFLIKPMETRSKMADLKGKEFEDAKNVQVIFNCIYKISLENKTAIAIKDFTLPASDGSEFFAEKYSFVMKKMQKAKDETKVWFGATYTGDKIGVVDFAKTKVLMPDGKEYPCNPDEHSPIILSKGTSRTFILDWTSIPAYAGNMEKATMIIKWADVCNEIPIDLVKMETVNLIGN